MGCEVSSTLGVDCEVVPLPLESELYRPGGLEEGEGFIACMRAGCAGFARLFVGRPGGLGALRFLACSPVELWPGGLGWLVVVVWRAWAGGCG